MTSPITIAEFGTRFDADLAVAKLVSYGIDAITRSDPAATIAPHLVTDRVFRVLVHRDLVEEATLFLAEADPLSTELDALFYVRGFRNRPPWIRKITVLLLIAVAGPVVLSTLVIGMLLLSHMYP